MSIPPPPPGFPSAPPPPPGYQAYQQADSVSQQRASFGIRLLGSFLDSLLYGLLAAVFVVPAFVLGAASVDDCTSTTTVDGTSSISCAEGELNAGLLLAGIGLGIIGLLVVFTLYVRALGRTGQTWGRKRVGVHVVDRRSGQPIGVGKAIGRTLFANFISGQVCYLGYLWMLWDKDKQTWHDKVVGSVAIRI